MSETKAMVQALCVELKIDRFAVFRKAFEAYGQGELTSQHLLAEQAFEVYVDCGKVPEEVVTLYIDSFRAAL